jgi:hypothetical protein
MRFLTVQAIETWEEFSQRRDFDEGIQRNGSPVRDIKPLQPLRTSYATFYGKVMWHATSLTKKMCRIQAQTSSALW